MRETLKRQRAGLDKKWIMDASATIVSSILKRDDFVASRRVACYLSLPGEVQTQSIVSACHEVGKSVCVPAWCEQQQGYRFARLQPGETLRTGADKTDQPCHPVWIEISDIDLIIIPGVAFDAHGGRLGRGGGCYDQLLSVFRGTRMGLAFEFQIVPEVPLSPHDINMHVIVTEKSVREMGK